MWGGIKHARDYSHHFREWSSSKPLENLRKALFREPRPWYLGFQIDKFNHAIDERTSEKLMRWCTSIVSLESNSTRRKEAYHNSHELFALMMNRKKLSDATLAQFFSLCEVGGDVTSAYQWIRLMVDQRREQASLSSDSHVEVPSSQQPYQLWHYVWLLRIVMRSPNDDVVGEMVQAVREVYETIFSPPSEIGVEGEDLGVKETSSDRSVVEHMVCDNFDEALLQRELFALARKLAPRIQDAELRSWCLRAESSLMISDEVAAATSTEVRSAMKLRHWVFPQLDAQIAPHEENAEISKKTGNKAFYQSPPTIENPYLIDSLLNPQFLEKLMSASTSFDVKGVGFWIQAFLEDIAAEKAKISSADQHTKKRQHTPTSTNPIPVWRDYRNPSHHEFRKMIIEDQGVPAELYHYLIVALSQTSPRLAVLTKSKMSARGMRTLDLTRAVLIAACKDSFDDQKALLLEQQIDFAKRVQLDIDFETPKVVEVYWKFEYHEFLHLRNGVKRMQDFYVLLMDALNVPDVQRLIAATSDTLIHEEELVAVDEEARDAVYRTLRKRRGAVEVEDALDIITEHCPMLDLALINSFPHFKEYTLADNDEIATTVDELSSRLFSSSSQPRDVYLMDSSFIETSERFFTASNQTGRERAIVIPWFCLKHLVETVDGVGEQCMDAEMGKIQKHERNVAIQRLQQISTMLLQQRAPGYVGPKFIVLHFSECLLAQSISRADFPSLSPETSDDDLMSSILLLLSTISTRTSVSTGEVLLCSDDPQLVEQVTNEETSTIASCLRQVTVLSTPPVEEADGMETQSSAQAVNMVNSVACDFVPNLGDDIVRIPRKDGNASQQRREREQDGGSAVSNVEVPPLPTTNDVQLSADDLFGEDSGPNGDDAKVPQVLQSQVLDTNASSSSSWISMLDGLEADHSSSAASSVASDSGALAAVQFPQGGPIIKDAPREQQLSESNETKENDDDSSLFSEFGVATPDERFEREMRRKPGVGHNELQKRRPSALHRESTQNAGASKRRRLQLARGLSNAVGGRVPFNFRYNVYEANVNDPRNTHLKRSYDEARSKKRVQRDR